MAKDTFSSPQIIMAGHPALKLDREVSLFSLPLSKISKPLSLCTRACQKQLRSASLAGLPARKPPPPLKQEGGTEQQAESRDALLLLNPELSGDRERL